MKYVFFCCCILILTSSQAQFLITPFAGISSNAKQSISYSGGESVIATLGDDDIFIMQGFQQQLIQTKAKSISIPSLIEINGETINGQKIVFGGDDYDVQTISQFLVFDPIGQIIYKKTDFELIEFQEWWDNSFNGRYLSGGIYFYFIEYVEQGQTETKTGSITKI